MGFIEELNNLSAKISRRKNLVKNEQATRNVLVEPFLELLGYDPSEPTEVEPESVADVPTRRSEKVDYAILKDAKVIMIVECKPYGENLTEDDVSQLYRYFSVTPVRIGILTDGVLCQFYSDLEEVNKMDYKPFLELNMLDRPQSLADELMMFTKSAFDLDKVVARARALKYTKEIMEVMREQLESPAEDFVQFFMSAVKGAEEQVEIQEFTDLVKQVLNQLMNEETDQSPQRDNQSDHPPELPASVKGKKIKGFEFEDKPYDAGDWTKYVLKFCKILSEKYPDRIEEVLTPNVLGLRRTCFSKNLNDFPERSSLPQQIEGTDIYVQTWLPPDQKRRLVWRLARHFECEDPQIEFAE